MYHIKKRQFWSIAICSAVALLLIAFNMLDGLFRSRQIERQHVENQLEEMARLEANVISSYMEDLVRRVQIGSFAIEALDVTVSPQAEELIHNKLNRVDAASLFIVTNPQAVYYVEDQYLPALNQMDFSQALKGETMISGVQYLNEYPESGFVVIAVPIWKGERIVGALGGVYPTYELSQALDFSCFTGQGYAHLIQSDGQFVIRSEHMEALRYDSNFFEMEQQRFSNGYSFEQMLDIIRGKRSGITHYTTSDGVEWYVYLLPAGINDWYIVSVVPAAVLNFYANHSLGLELKVIGKNLIILIAYFALILYLREGNGREIKQMLKELTKAHAKLLASEERFRLAASHSSGLILERRAGAEKGEIISYNETDGKILPERSALESLDWKELIHPEDYVRSSDIHRQLFSESKAIKLTLRLRSRAVAEESCQRDIFPRWKCDGSNCPEENCSGGLRNVFGTEESDGDSCFSCDLPPSGCPGRYRWYQMTVTALEKENEDFSILITLEDVDSQYQERETLEMLARQDSLTGLLNRAACEQTVTERLLSMEPGERASFLLLDLDDFKSINDRLGHNMGDKVLIEFARLLKKHFRESDPVGRLGGDEFVVFMAKLDDPEIIRKKVLELNQAVERWSARMHWVDRSLFSVSAGAVFAEAGDSFHQLYRQADAALYLSKDLGKRRCSFFTQPAPSSLELSEQ